MKRSTRTKKKTNWIISALATALFLAGLCLLLYPLVSDMLAKQQSAKTIQNYEQTITQQSSQDLSQALSAAYDYNARLVNSAATISDPFDPNAQVVASSEYANLLNQNHDGIMGVLTIPKISVQLPIYHGTDSKTLEKGVGHLESTSLPVGGISTHAVLTGHTGLPSAVLFDHLDQLAKGDTFQIQVLGKTIQYEVYQIEVVLPEETESLRIQTGKDLVTLVTCTPYGVNSHRLLVHARRTSDPSSAVTVGSYTPASSSFIYWYYLGLLLGLILFGIVFFVILRRRKKKTEQDRQKQGFSAKSVKGALPKHLKSKTFVR